MNFIPNGTPLWDTKALAIIAQIERLILGLELESQPEFVSILNALENQVESGAPSSSTVDCLCKAILALASDRGINTQRLGLQRRLLKLQRRIARFGSAI